MQIRRPNGDRLLFTPNGYAMLTHHKPGHPLGFMTLVLRCPNRHNVHLLYTRGQDQRRSAFALELVTDDFGTLVYTGRTTSIRRRGNAVSNS